MHRCCTSSNFIQLLAVLYDCNLELFVQGIFLHKKSPNGEVRAVVILNPFWNLM